MSLEAELDRLPAVLWGTEREAAHASQGDPEGTIARLQRKIIHWSENKNRAATARLLESELYLLKVALSGSPRICAARNSGAGEADLRCRASRAAARMASVSPPLLGTIRSI